jgi:hypothetical protein
MICISFAINKLVEAKNHLKYDPLTCQKQFSSYFIYFLFYAKILKINGFSKIKLIIFLKKLNCTPCVDYRHEISYNFGNLIPIIHHIIEQILSYIERRLILSSS